MNDKYKDFLEYTADCIEEHFKDYDNSPFVQEKFYDDWSHDETWGWQQNRDDYELPDLDYRPKIKVRIVPI